MSDGTFYYPPGHSLSRRVHGERSVGLFYFGIRWSSGRESAFRSLAAAHRRARRAMPRPLRRGRNDIFFDTVSRVGREPGGTFTPELHPSGA